MEKPQETTRLEDLQKLLERFNELFKRGLLTSEEYQMVVEALELQGLQKLDTIEL